MTSFNVWEHVDHSPICKNIASAAVGIGSDFAIYTLYDNSVWMLTF